MPIRLTKTSMFVDIQSWLIGIVIAWKKGIAVIKINSLVILCLISHPRKSNLCQSIIQENNKIIMSLSIYMITRKLKNLQLELLEEALWQWVVDLTCIVSTWIEKITNILQWSAKEASGKSGELNMFTRGQYTLLNKCQKLRTTCI